MFKDEIGKSLQQIAQKLFCSCCCFSFQNPCCSFFGFSFLTVGIRYYPVIQNVIIKCSIMQYINTIKYNSIYNSKSVSLLFKKSFRKLRFSNRDLTFLLLKWNFFMHRSAIVQDFKEQRSNACGCYICICLYMGAIHNNLFDILQYI